MPYTLQCDTSGAPNLKSCFSKFKKLLTKVCVRQIVKKLLDFKIPLINTSKTFFKFHISLNTFN